MTGPPNGLLAMATPPSDVTQLLLAWDGDNREVLDRLTPLVYEELRRLASRHLHHERPGHTLTTTALVHEAYVKLVDQDRAQWQNRAHFFAIAAQCMRRILLMHARKRRAAKRGGGQPDLPLDDVIVVSEARADELLALNDALSQLEAMDERLGQVVECRYFGGLTIEETAEVLGVSAATVKRDWRTARAWLHRALSQDG